MLPVAPGPGSPPGSFARIEEYKSVLENLGEYGARRQATTAVFVGLNTVFLTGIGALLVTAHTDSWQLVAEVAAISLAVTPVNVIWAIALQHYKKGLDLRYQYLQAIEAGFPQLPNESAHGLISKLHVPDTKGRYHHRHTSLELALARYVICVYPALALVFAGVTYLLTNGIIHPLS